MFVQQYPGLRNIKRGMVRYGTARYGMVWYGLAPFGGLMPVVELSLAI